MLRDAERFRRDDEEAKRDRIAKSKLETYIYNMTSRVKETKAKGAMNIGGLEFIEQMLSSVGEWLEENEWAKANVLEGKLKILKGICSPFTYRSLFFDLMSLE